MRRALLAVVALCIACGGAQKPSEPELEPDRTFPSEDLAEVLPASLEVLVGGSPASFLGWPASPDVVSLLGADAVQWIARLESCGVPPRDLDELVAGGGGEAWVIAVRGRFTAAAALACGRTLLERRGAQVVESELRGQRVYRSSSIADEALFAVPRDGLVLIATSPKLLERTLAGEVPRLAEAPADLLGLADAVRTDGTVWFAAGSSSSWVGRAREAFDREAIGLAGRATIGDDGSLELFAVAEMAGQGDAEHVAAFLDATLEGARPELEARGAAFVIERAELAADGTWAALRLAFTAAEVEFLFATERAP